MQIAFYIFTVLTALLHVLFFKLESLDFMKPTTLSKFGLKPEHGAVVKIWAFNQGFYNLFLALGLLYSIYCIEAGGVAEGLLLARFILLTIVGAGAVLFYSAPKKVAAALVQAAPALLGFLLSCFM